MHSKSARMFSRKCANCFTWNISVYLQPSQVLLLQYKFERIFFKCHLFTGEPEPEIGSDQKWCRSATLRGTEWKFGIKWIKDAEISCNRLVTGKLKSIITEWRRDKNKFGWLQHQTKVIDWLPVDGWVNLKNPPYTIPVRYNTVRVLICTLSSVSRSNWRSIRLRFSAQHLSVRSQNYVSSDAGSSKKNHDSVSATVSPHHWYRYWAVKNFLIPLFLGTGTLKNIFKYGIMFYRVPVPVNRYRYQYYRYRYHSQSAKITVQTCNSEQIIPFNQKLKILRLVFWAFI